MEQEKSYTAEEIWEAHLKCVEDGVLSRQLEKSDFMEIFKIASGNEQSRILREVNALDTTKFDSTMALKLAIIKIVRGEKF